MPNFMLYLGLKLNCTPLCRSLRCQKYIYYIDIMLRLVQNLMPDT